MSEVPNNNNEDLFESISSQDAPDPAVEAEVEPTVEAQPEQEWVTVNFPDAIAVEQIPHEPEPSQTSIRIQELEQQNHRLMARVSELEAALTRSETFLRTETERLEQAAGAQFAIAEERAQRDAEITRQQAAMIAKQRHALDAAKQRLQDQETQLEARSQLLTEAQSQIKLLAQDLDLGHQTNQKQQILVETLTGQLQASQEQVAQLERECALIKQQYDEQTQLTRQAENNCKDLRSRLNRQQQYTLQFKAALEKCLDVPTAQVTMAAETAQRAIDEEELCSASPTEFVRAQPVQPWSSTLGFSPEPDVDPWAAESGFAADLDSEPVETFELEPVSDALPELLETEIAMSEAPDFEPEYVESVAPVSEPEPPAKPLSYTIQRPEEPSNEPKRLQLFFPSGEPELQFEFPSVETSAPIENLAIEPVVLPAESTEVIAPVQEESLAIELSQNPWSNAFEMEAEVFEVSEEEASPAEVEASEPPFIAPLNSPFITFVPGTTRVAESAELQPAIAEAVETEASPVGDNSPSPVVYPERPQKKLTSLAAVDLPSFPRPAK